MPLPTIITWAGSWPEPDPWITETLSSLGASVRMIRLYSGTYLSVSGFASAMPLSISGTNCRGSLTNFFTPLPPGRARTEPGGTSEQGADWYWLGLGRTLRPVISECLEHHGDSDGSGIQGADAAFAGIAGPAAQGLHRPRCLGSLTRSDRRGPQCRSRVGTDADLLLDRVGGRHDRVEQRLVADVGTAACLDAVGRRSEHRDHLDRLQLGDGPGGGTSPQERRPPDRAGGTADAARDDHGDLLQEGTDVGAVEAVPVLQHQLEPARHRVAEVAVADHRVQVAEILLVVDRDRGDRAHDELDVAQACCRHGRSLSQGGGRRAGRRLRITAAGQDAGKVSQGDPLARRGPAAVGE